MIQKKTTFLVMSVVVIATLAGAGGFFAAERLHQAEHTSANRTTQSGTRGRA